MAKSKSKIINTMRQNDKRTEKGMLTNSTSLNSCVDMFFMAGATRHWTKEEKIKLFLKAYTENPLISMKILFWSRDIRAGAGEREFFRTILTFINEKYPILIKKNAHLIPEFGRWDDLFLIKNNVIFSLIKKGIEEENGLLSKWLPRKKQYNNIASEIRKYLKLSPKEYRKLIVRLSDTVEQKMCDKKFNEIDYEKVPSMAMNKYRKAFYRNDEDRFKNYIEDVKGGDAKINANAIYPHIIYRALIKSGRADINTFKIKEDEAIEAQWNALPNYMDKSKNKLLPLIDVSPSMTWNGGLPLEVAISLGIYISERNESIFKDAFMTFSETPTMEYLKGSFAERVYQLRYAKWGYKTNLEKSFDVLLKIAVDNNINQNEMPSVILIISDMQFDKASIFDDNAIDMIEKKYNQYNYNLPHIIFWNVRAEEDNVPVNDDKKGVGLISGFSPAILKDILKGEIKKKPTPFETMMKVINSNRYNSIRV